MVDGASPSLLVLLTSVGSCVRLHGSCFFGFFVPSWLFIFLFFCVMRCSTLDHSRVRAARGHARTSSHTDRIVGPLQGRAPTLTGLLDHSRAVLLEATPGPFLLLRSFYNGPGSEARRGLLPSHYSCGGSTARVGPAFWYYCRSVGAMRRNQDTPCYFPCVPLPSRYCRHQVGT